MMKYPMILSAAVLCVTSTAWAQRSPFSDPDQELFFLLRRKPDQAIFRGAQRVEVVNARFERCMKKKDAKCLFVITPKDGAYNVLAKRANGQLLMEGTSVDALGKVLHGSFHYYDDAGTLRAEGRYDHGVKTGALHRYDDRGQTLSDKEYDGLDWEGEQVKLGLASISGQVEDIVWK